MRQIKKIFWIKIEQPVIAHAGIDHSVELVVEHSIFKIVFIKLTMDFIRSRFEAQVNIGHGTPFILFEHIDAPLRIGL